MLDNLANNGKARPNSVTFMNKAASRELRLARRMARLGTETAFEVLVKARALEAKGRDIVHLEIGDPYFDTPRNIIDAGCIEIGLANLEMNNVAPFCFQCARFDQN